MSGDYFPPELEPRQGCTYCGASVRRVLRAERAQYGQRIQTMQGYAGTIRGRDETIVVEYQCDGGHSITVDGRERDREPAVRRPPPVHPVVRARQGGHRLGVDCAFCGVRVVKHCSDPPHVSDVTGLLVQLKAEDWKQTCPDGAPCCKRCGDKVHRHVQALVDIQLLGPVVHEDSPVDPTPLDTELLDETERQIDEATRG